MEFGEVCGYLWSSVECNMPLIFNFVIFLTAVLLQYFAVSFAAEVFTPPNSDPNIAVFQYFST